MAETWDVVCGMKGDTERWTSVSVYKGRKYYFCCDGCKVAFEKSPDYHIENFSEEHPGVDPAGPERA